ncbi:MAG: NAD+ synthase (glutamine-hydrolyzing) [Lysobacterales bacterium]|jgi:NAD+ synthase (glutamine-hydrolysing)
MRIAQAQINVTVGDLLGNEEKILSYIDQAKNVQADVIVFPEMALTGYPPEDLLLKEHFIQDNKRVLKEIAAKTRGVRVIVGFVDRDDKGLYNAAAFIEDGKIKQVYHKQKLPNYGVFDERRYFKSGTKSVQTFKIDNVKCAINICEDIWNDDGPFVKQAKKGAKIIFNLSSSPYDYTKHKQRLKLLRDRSKQTQVHIIYTNLVGGQDELVFDGGSVAINPDGKVLSSANLFEEQMTIVDIPVGKESVTGKVKIKTHKAKKLTINESIYKALVLGTKDYIHKNGFKKVVIGLSGGIDSALVAAVAVDGIGRDNVVGVSMPSRYSSKGTQSDARRLAECLGIEFKEIPIEPLVKAFDQALDPYFKGLKSGIAEENIQARVRGNLLMALSNKFGWMVLTTGNKSEMAVGYCTLYGDMSGGFAPIKDVPKTKVYELSEYRNTLGKVVIPETVITRAPSAELRENQEDQDSLPPYDVLDALLHGYVEKHQSLSQMTRKGHKDEAKRIIGLVDQSEYKRRQSPPGVKITPLAFGRDWRPPITNNYKEF